MVSRLWQSDDPKLWIDHLEAAKDRLKALKDDRLAQLDEWFCEELPHLITAKCPDNKITGEELVKLVEWKLKRGKWRPKLLDYAKSLKDDDVQEQSRAALKQAEKIAKAEEPPKDNDKGLIQDALKPLIELKGVGPATASAILTAYNPGIPFMSDEAMAAAQTGPKEYTVARYLEFAHALRLKAHNINQRHFDSRPASERQLCRVLTAQDIERALWSEAILQKSQKKVTGKRKNSET